MSVVLVTGSSTGIGLATALHFGRLGDGVYAGVRNIATATELTKAIEAEKLPVYPIVLDVDDQASATRAVGEVLGRAGRIDALVNNAGIGGGGPVEDVPVDWVKSLFEVPRADASALRVHLVAEPAAHRWAKARRASAWGFGSRFLC